MSQTLLVTGASGQLGRAVLAYLLDTLKVDPARIVAASRKVESLRDVAARGVTVRPADFDDAGSLDRAFAGVARLLLISTDSLEGGKRLAQHRAAVAAAERAGVKHVVYTSLPEADVSAVSFAPDHAGTEAALAASRIPGFTVLRNGWYFENVRYGAPPAIQSGRWYTAAGSGALSHIARNDLALAAAHALAAQTNGRSTLTLTGERAYTTAEIAKQVSDRLAAPIEVVQVSVEDLVKGLVVAGFPEPVARVFASFDEAIRKGHLGGVTRDFEKLTGVRPQSFESWIAANGESLRGQ
jgi:NAD(P)H dehydrogenase (quinone)